MATILMNWELGGGFGHMTRLCEVGRRLVRRGHRVVAALRDLYRAGAAFDGTGIQLMQAPFKQRATAGTSKPIISYAHILRNTAFGDLDELRSLANGWRHLFEFIHPDILIFDHSPTALLAARGFDVPRAIVGDGFEYPPDVFPLPDMKPWLDTDTDRLKADELLVLHHANTILSEWQLPVMDQMSHLYHPINHVFMFTLEAIDPFGHQREVEYFTVVPVTGGESPHWPDGNGKRAFAYLKSFENLPALVKALDQLQVRTLIYAPEANTDQSLAANVTNVRFLSRPVNVKEVAAQCDFAILNGTNGTVAEFLQAGKPMLNIPILLNQSLNAFAVEKMGAGLVASHKRPAEMVARLTDLIESDRCSQAASHYAAHYTPPSSNYDEIADRMESLL